MSEMSFEQMLEESLKTIRNGEVVEGTVIDVKPDEIILNIGYKSDGIISRSEYTNEPNVDLTTVVKVGDTLSAKVVKVNDGEGQVVLSYKRLAAEKGSKRLEEAFENKEVLTARSSQQPERVPCLFLEGDCPVNPHAGCLTQGIGGKIDYLGLKCKLTHGDCCCCC